MTDRKISELTELTSADAADVLPIADVSASETKKITVANLRAMPPEITADYDLGTDFAAIHPTSNTTRLSLHSGATDAEIAYLQVYPTGVGSEQGFDLLSWKDNTEYADITGENGNLALSATGNLGITIASDSGSAGDVLTADGAGFATWEPGTGLPAGVVLVNDTELWGGTVLANSDETKGVTLISGDYEGSEAYGSVELRPSQVTVYNQSADGSQSVQLRMTGADGTLALTLTGALTITGLPTADPGVAGQLYTDGAPSAGTPKALMVSGG